MSIKKPNQAQKSYLHTHSRWVRENIFGPWSFWISKKLKPLSSSPCPQSVWVLVRNVCWYKTLYMSGSVGMISLFYVYSLSSILVVKTHVRCWDIDHGVNLSVWKILLVFVSPSCQNQCCSSLCVFWMLRLRFGTQNRQGCIKIRRIRAFWF